MTRPDDILDLIDAGLQSSTEHGYGTDPNPDLCARRCGNKPADGDLCAGCRAFLLGDSDEDPKPLPPGVDPADVEWLQSVAAVAECDQEVTWEAIQALRDRYRDRHVPLRQSPLDARWRFFGGPLDGQLRAMPGRPPFYAPVPVEMTWRLDEPVSDDTTTPDPTPIPVAGDMRVTDDLDDILTARSSREQHYRRLVVDALSRRGQELRELHHLHLHLDANAREKIADIVLDALGLTGSGDPCDCSGPKACHGAAIYASICQATQCRQYTVGWPA